MISKLVKKIYRKYDNEIEGVSVFNLDKNIETVKIKKNKVYLIVSQRINYYFISAFTKSNVSYLTSNYINEDIIRKCIKAVKIGKSLKYFYGIPKNDKFNKLNKFRKGSKVVCVLTGSGLKDPDTAIKFSQKPVTVKADLKEVVKVLKW